MTFEIVPVWKAVTPELAAGLAGLWTRNGAIPDGPGRAARASQAVCVARDPARPDTIHGVGTAVIRVLPRLRQPMYYYRQYFAEDFRGRRQTVPFFNRARQVLQDYNAALDRPEALGVLLELENPMLAKRYDRAFEPDAGSIFIGYSPRGLQLRVSYFDDARLLPPTALPGRRAKD